MPNFAGNHRRMNSTVDSKRSSAPSRLWYLLAVAIGICGFVAMAVYMMPRMERVVEKLIQVLVPGEAELSLSEAGGYTIFHETHSIVDGKIFVSAPVSGLRVTLTSAETGMTIPVTPPMASANYSYGSRSGVSILTFKIDVPGRYRLVAAYDDGRADAQIVLAIGHEFNATLLTTIAVSIMFAFAGVGAGAWIVYRVRSKRKAARAASAGGR